MRFTHFLSALLANLLIVSTLTAQELPFRNFSDWGYVSTEYFDVYFAGDQEEAAVKVAKYAELARFELGVLYDYKPQERYNLIYLSSTEEFLHTNFEKQNPERDMSFQLPTRAVNVIDQGESKLLYQSVKQSVSELILEEFAFGERAGATIQSQLLLHIPTWFHEGLSAYAASGWTYEDELWMNTLSRSDNILEMALEGEEKINEIVRKSIWYFITHEYGDQKISEIIYLVNISHSIEAGIISVLGITLNTLTERWREFILSRSTAQGAGRSDLAELSGVSSLEVDEKMRVTSFAYNDNEEKVAMFLSHQGRQHLYLYDVGTEDFDITSIHSSYQNPLSAKYPANYPIAWSPAGDKLVTVIYTKQSYRLVYYNLFNNQSVILPLGKDITQVMSLAWSPDGSTIAMSASHLGRSDLFVTKAEDNKFRAITDDIYDDLDPSWSTDGRSLYFSSNRPNATLPAAQVDWEQHRSYFDLFSISVANQGGLSRITKTPLVNERNPRMAEAGKLVYVSDESGIFNFYQINPANNSFRALSNLSAGVESYSISDNQMVVASPLAGKNNLFLLSKDDLIASRTPQPTLLRLDKLSMIQNQLAKAEARKQAAERLERMKELQAEQKKQQAEKKEEKKAEESDKPVRFYLFDEDDGPYEVRRPDPLALDKKANNEVINTVFGENIKPELAEVEVSKAYTAAAGWQTDALQLGIIYDPVAGYGLDLGVSFSDMLDNQRLSLSLNPYIKFRNRDIALKYEYLKYRPDFHLELKNQGRKYDLEPLNRQGLDTLNFQFEHFQANAGVTYPINRYLSAGLELGYHRITRTDLKLIRPNLLDDEANVARATARISYNNVQMRENFAYKGVEAELAMHNYYSITESRLRFQTAQFQAKHYVELFDKIVLASQVRIGISFAENRTAENDDRQQFYLGGIENLILPVSFEENNNDRIEFIDVSPDLYDFMFQEFLTPNRGFDFFARNGSRYVMTNFELRIPLSRLLKQHLNSSALYNLEFIPFFDVGTVWDQGNPFSTKKPTDTQIVGSNPVVVQLQTLKSPFLFGFGTGLRTNLSVFSVRLDLAWGVDDNTLQAPFFTTTLAKNF